MLKDIITKLTLEDIKSFYKIFRGNFQNRITKSVIYGGLAMIGSHWIYDIIDALFSLQFGKNIFGDKSDIFGTILVAMGLSYNAFITKVQMNKFVPKKTDDITHDQNIFNSAEWSESDFISIIEILKSGKIEGKKWEFLNRISQHFSLIDNKFIDSVLADKMVELVESLENFHEILYEVNLHRTEHPLHVMAIPINLSLPDVRFIYRFESKEDLSKALALAKGIRKIYRELRVLVTSRLGI